MNSTILGNKGTSYSMYLDEEIIDLLDKTFNIPSDYSCDVIEVSQGYTARPDLLANDMLGNENYAELICKLNGISNPYELNEGMILIIPRISSLSNFNIFPNSAWNQSKTEIEESFESDFSVSSSSGTTSTSSKKSKSKKTNSAKVNSSRFTIDNVSKVIIY